ncbi:hypothetical protein EGW08_004891, partial [Elysia chlorotica]
LHQAQATISFGDSEPPTLSIQPRYIQVNEGERAELRCIVEGRPTPTITWTKKSNLPLPDYAYTDETGVLRFESATLDDQSDYFCRASNSEGTTELRTIIYVRPRGPPTITVTPGTRVVSIVGSRVFMECVATGEPTPTVSWKSGQRRRSDVLPEASDPGAGSAQLLFERVSFSQAGTYICEASNDYGSSTEIVVLEVNDEDSTAQGIRGASIEGPERQTLTVGQSAELRCIADGLVNPRYNWRRPGGLALPPGHSVRNGILYIPNIEAEDSGEYICTIYSDPYRPDLPLQENKASVYIIVTVTPRAIIYPSGGMTAVADTSFFLNCTVQGPGPYEIEWRKEPGPLSPMARDENGVLSIDRVAVTDAGTYICVVTSPNGVTIEESTTVRVY